MENINEKQPEMEKVKQQIEKIDLKKISIKNLEKEFEIGEKFNYAGFWIRHVAYFFDLIFLSLLLSWIYFISISSNIYSELLLEYSFYFTISLYLAYFTFFHYLFNQSLWKMIMWIATINKKWNNISFLQSIWRTFWSVISMVSPFQIWYLLTWWNEKKKALHDFLAQTMVIEERGTPWWLVFILNFIIVSWMLVGVIIWSFFLLSIFLWVPFEDIFKTLESLSNIIQNGGKIDLDPAFLDQIDIDSKIKMIEEFQSKAESFDFENMDIESQLKVFEELQKTFNIWWDLELDKLFKK